MKQITTILAALLFCLTTLNAAPKSESEKCTAKHTLNGVTTEITFYTPSIVRVLKYPEGNKKVKVTYSIIKSPEKVKVKSSELDDAYCYTSENIVVTVDKKTGVISFTRPCGTSLIKEKCGSTIFEPKSDIGEATYRVAQTFILDKDEDIYGLGQQQRGAMSQRGMKYEMFNRNMHICIPYIYSPKGYGLYWDNYSASIFEDSENGTLFDSEVGDCIDYYLFVGNNADEVISAVREMSGEAQMCPLWTLGFWQCRERYESQAQLLEMLHKYRDLQVPLDGVIQDWRYWGADLTDPMWNSMRFDNPLFPDPQAMIDEVHANNAHIMISVWPSFGPATEQYKSLDSINALLDFSTWPTGIGVKAYDPTHPKSGEIYWNHLKNILAMDMDSWWLDGTEPDHFDRTEKDMQNKMYYGSYRRMKNVYPIACVKNVYEKLRVSDPKRRAYLMTRSAAFGQQRYTAGVWSGDVYGLWSVLKSQIAAAQNFVLCGNPYWNSDIGGFFAWSYGDNVKNKEYQELHVRWLQMATFNPVMRSHNSSPTKVEIYQFGEPGDWAFDAQKRFIELRYRLLPYSYTTAWQVATERGNFIRPLLMDFPNDKAAQNLPTQFMYGKNILVAAITEKMYTDKGWSNDRQPEPNNNGTEDFSVVKSAKAYLPAGTAWWDYFTEQEFDGGQNVNRPTPIDEFPVYIKAGSIMPYGPDVQYSTEKRWDKLEIKVYPGADGQFTLYEDEFDGYNFEKGEYTEIPFSWNETTQELTIGKRQGSYNGMLKERIFVVKVAGTDKELGVLYNGKSVTVKL
ncbi:MAG: DUF5110 domain-containing protein [Marinifilaceae bacterium]|nr:DUF5110 domain-containing protein [Marinifilaceae bacterium]